MKLLITGSQGFIGKALLQLLRDHEVYALCRTQPLDLAANETWIEADLSNLDTATLPTVDCVIHLAQSTRYREFPEGTRDMHAVNVSSTHELLRWAHSGGAKKFIFTSTGTVYEPFTHGMTESTLPRPTSFYPASKYAAEVLCQPYAHEIALCTFRPFFVYGPGQQGMMIANLIDAVASRRELTLPSDGRGLRFSPTYVSDAARVIVRSVVDEEWRGTWNLASPYTAEFVEVVQEIGRSLNVEPLINITEASSPTPIVADVSALEERLGEFNWTHWRDGIGHTVEAYRAK